MLSFKLRVLDSAFILTQCVHVCLCDCVSFCICVCVCCEEGKASDKWLSFGPGELFTNTCFIFSAQEGKRVYVNVYVHVCVCVFVCEREREGERAKKRRIKKQIANLELHPDSSKNEGSCGWGFEIYWGSNI